LSQHAAACKHPRCFALLQFRSTSQALIPFKVLNNVFLKLDGEEQPVSM
jgi:hypothetical protein